MVSTDAGETVDIAACFGYLHGATKGVNDDITIFGNDFGLSSKPNITAFYPSGHGAHSYSGEPLLELSRVCGTAPAAASQTFKNLPDVSSAVSVESAVLFVLKRALIQSGGTSAASPTLAGTVALIQQAIQKYDHVTVSYWPAALYATPQIFTDITKGSNGRYNARPGYDNVTGIGVPCFYGFFNTSLCANNN